VSESRSRAPDDRDVPEIFTIGHVAMPIEEFIDLLKRFDITLLVDIRRFPVQEIAAIRLDALRERLDKPGSLCASGGLGRTAAPRADSQNAVANARSRLCDYRKPKEFEKALRELIELARQRVASCVRSCMWRCHGVVSDALMHTVAGVAHHERRQSATAPLYRTGPARTWRAHLPPVVPV